MSAIKNPNRKAGRKLDVLAILKRDHALSLMELSARMGLHHRSIRRYVTELLQEKKIFRNYKATPDGGGRPYYHYSYRRK